MQVEKIIFILGMHRSGTSALAGTLQLCGIDIGKDIIEGREDNPKGFYENQKINNLNEKILHELNSSWHSVFKLSDNWIDNFNSKEFEDEFDYILKTEFENMIISIKDPRICLLLPLYQKFLKNKNIESKYIIINRNPLEIAESIKIRNNFSYESTFINWMNHIFNSVYYTNNYNRVFVSFDNLLNSEAFVIKQIANAFDFQYIYENYKKHFYHGFLETNLKHHNISLEKLKEVEYPFIYKLYQNLYLLTLGGKQLENHYIPKIMELREEYLKSYNLFYHKEMME